MKKITRTLFVISLLSFFVGCSAYQYVPTTANVPLFEEKNEFKGNVGLYNYQVGYSFTDHFAMTSNFMWQKQDDSGWSDRFGGKEGNKVGEGENSIYDLELGLGYYTKLSSFNFETFVGAGYGKLEYEHSVTKKSTDDYFYKMESNPLKIYLQANLGKKFKNQSSLALSLKLIDYKFTNTDLTVNNYREDTGDPEDLFAKDGKTKDLYFIQPSLTYRVGRGFFSFQAQTGYSHCLNLSDWNDDNFYIRLSLFFTISSKKDKN